jgi:glycosyltransferase involved in cell wall biosynthesis
MKRSLGMGPVLAALGHDVTIVMQDHEENREWSRRTAGVKFVFFKEAKLLVERRWKTRHIASSKYDVVVINSLCWRNAVKTKNASGVMPIYIVEHCELESSFKQAPIIKRVAQYFLEFGVLYSIENHMCASRYLLDFFKRRAFFWRLKRNVFWCPYGVDDELCANQPSLLPGDDGKLRILHIGSLAAGYGCMFMLKGLRNLLDYRKDWTACFVGRGPDYLDAIKYSAELGLNDFVVFTGYASEERLRLELDRAHVCLSHLGDIEKDWARCPSKIYYYMAKLKPVVTTALGENQIALGESGFYYRHDDTVDFSRVLSKAMDAVKNWQPLYTSKSVGWFSRTQEFLSNMRQIKLK